MNTNSNLFSSNENKALLWSVLHGGGKFDGIPDASFHNIKVMFETTINEMGESHNRANQHMDLNVMNKEAVFTICKRIELMKSGQMNKQMHQMQQMQPTPSHAQSYQKKQQQPPQLQTIYKAEDIQKERQNAFNNELKKKEEEIASIIKLRKPEEIKFTDDIYDKPIGDDMERLLAETLASREKELEQLQPKHSTTVDVKENNGSTNTQTLLKPKVNIEKHEKHVSFGNNLQVEHIYENYEGGSGSSFENENNVSSNNNNDYNRECNSFTQEQDSITDLFNKFKKIKKNNVSPSNSVDINHSDEFKDELKTTVDNNMIIKMSEDIAFIKNELVELSKKINKL